MSNLIFKKYLGPYVIFILYNKKKGFPSLFHRLFLNQVKQKTLKNNSHLSAIAPETIVVAVVAKDN